MIYEATCCFRLQLVTGPGKVPPEGAVWREPGGASGVMEFPGPLESSRL